MAMDPFIGRVIGERYRLVAKLGAGAFGWVYRAEHVRLESSFAVKILNADPKERPDLGARFEREAKTTSRLRHPNVVSIVDYGEEPDIGLYLVMDYLEGESLEARIQRLGALPAAEVTELGVQVAGALGAAHAEGIVHRDVKPANVVLLHEEHRRDTAMVLDFGIAALQDSRSTLTGVGAAIGSPAYMSPEVINGGRADPRSDIYSFGVSLYEMATGRLPFWSDNFIAIYSMHVEDPPPPPREICPEADVPVALQDVILRCLAKAPADRFATMGEVAEALEGVRRSLAAAQSVDLADTRATVAARGPSRTPAAATISSEPARSAAATRTATAMGAPPRRRRRWTLLAGAAIVVLAAATGAFFALKSGDGDTATDGRAGEPAAATATERTAGAGAGAGADDTGPDDTGPDDTGPDDTGPDDTGPAAAGPDGASPSAAVATAASTDAGAARAAPTQPHGDVVGGAADAADDAADAVDDDADDDTAVGGADTTPTAAAPAPDERKPAEKPKKRRKPKKKDPFADL